MPGTNGDSAIANLPGTPTSGLPASGQELDSKVFNGMFSQVPDGAATTDEPDDAPATGGGPDLTPPATFVSEPAYIDPFADAPADTAPSAVAPAPVTPAVAPAAAAPGSPATVDAIALAVENERLKNQMGQLAPLAPLMKFLQEKRPDILETISAAINETTEGSAQSAPLKAPEPPARPAAYNPAEAFANPDSESWKYREALEKFNQDKIEFLQKQIERRDQAQQAQLRKVQEREKEEAFRQQSYRDALANGLNEAEAADYVKVMSHPLTLDPKNLVKYYRILRKESPRQKPANTPPIPGGGFTVPQGDQTALQQGFTGMLNSWKTRR